MLRMDHHLAFQFSRRYIICIYVYVYPLLYAVNCLFLFIYMIHVNTGQHHQVGWWVRRFRYPSATQRSSQKQPKKLMRALLAVFFEPHILAKSCALGTRSGNAGLDKEILGACICKYLLCFLCYLLNFRIFSLTFHCCRLCSDTTWCSWTVLIDTVNDKCAQCRRQLKKKSTGMLV